MACVTLKRAHELEASPPSSKRRRFHCGGGRGAAALTFVPPPSCPPEAEADDFPSSRLSPEQLSQRLTAEVRRLQRRRLLSCGRRSPDFSAASADAEMPTTATSTTAATATATAACQCDRGQDQGHGQGHGALFTLPQLHAITDKLLRERELQLRHEFERLLSRKLQEQYESFLKFNHDQLYRQHTSKPMSYVS